MGPNGKQKRRPPAHSDRGRASRSGSARSEKSSPTVFLPALKPRKRLLVVLSAVLALWVAFLLYLYFATVFPHRNDARPQPPTPTTLRSIS